MICFCIIKYVDLNILIVKIMILIDGPGSLEPGSIRSHTSRNTLQGVSYGEQVFHQVVNSNLCCMLPVQTFTTRYRSKT